MAASDDDKFICLCDKCLTKYSERPGPVRAGKTCANHRVGTKKCYCRELTRIGCVPSVAGYMYPKFPLPGLAPHEPENDDAYRKHFQGWIQEYLRATGGVAALLRPREGHSEPGQSPVHESQLDAHPAVQQEAASPSNTGSQVDEEFVPYDGILDEDTVPLSAEEARRRSLDGVPIILSGETAGASAAAAAAAAAGGATGQPVPEWLLNRQPGCDGSTARSRLQKRHYHLHPDATDETTVFAKAFEDMHILGFWLVCPLYMHHM